MTLASHSGEGSAGYVSYIAAVTAMLRQQGVNASTAAQSAVGVAYQQLLRQASMLSYQNAFFVLAVTIGCLSPLPFLMRLPSKAEKPSPEEAMAH